MKPPLAPNDFQATLSTVSGLNVSRETFEGLEKYISFLAEVSQTHNLMGPKELPRVWQRHVLDSAQLAPFLKTSHGVADLGAGAGFPGVVLALLGIAPLHLVEATQKKCRFLEDVSRETSSPFQVHPVRCEALKAMPATHVVSRAMAPVAQILLWARGWVKPHHVFVLMKGAQLEVELQAARRIARFQSETHKSHTSDTGRIVILKNIIFI